jgi:hypothetical protein
MIRLHIFNPIKIQQPKYWCTLSCKTIFKIMRFNRKDSVTPISSVSKEKGKESETDRKNEKLFNIYYIIILLNVFLLNEIVYPLFIGLQLLLTDSHMYVRHSILEWNADDIRLVDIKELMAQGKRKWRDRREMSGRRMRNANFLIWDSWESRCCIWNWMDHIN